jgi:hypothetical protein
MNVYTEVSDAKTLQALRRLGRQFGATVRLRHRHTRAVGGIVNISGTAILAP